MWSKRADVFGVLRWLLACMFTVAFSTVVALPAGAGAQPDPQPLVTYGVFDPEHWFRSSNRIGIEHVFIVWTEDDASRLSSALDYASKRNRWLMVTVEPWPLDWNSKEEASSLFGDIVKGRFDTVIAGICRKLGDLKVPLFIRWGHEMDDLSGRYPWARPDAADFVNAYRHVVDACRPLAPLSYFVWSPAGRGDMLAYYPGDQYADWVGVSVYGLERLDLKQIGRPRGFDDVFGPKYALASRFHKPVMIAELGIAGDADYKRDWMKQITHAAENFPLLRAIVYFNAREPESWPEDQGKPDWRINPVLFPDPFSHPPSEAPEG